MQNEDKNLLVILSSPSGVGKTTLTKKSNKNTTHLKYLYLIPQDPQDRMR